MASPFNLPSTCLTLVPRNPRCLLVVVSWRGTLPDTPRARSGIPQRASNARHARTHKMAFALSKTASLVATPKASSKIARRGAVVVRAEKVAHGKGGEEGGRSFANDAFGMVAKNANYGLFAAAVTKVRLRRALPRTSRAFSERARRRRRRAARVRVETNLTERISRSIDAVFSSATTRDRAPRNPRRGVARRSEPRARARRVDANARDAIERVETRGTPTSWIPRARVRVTADAPSNAFPTSVSWRVSLFGSSVDLTTRCVSAAAEAHRRLS